MRRSVNKMTDKQFIETLRNIKNYCKDRFYNECKFFDEPDVEKQLSQYCVLRNMGFIFSMSPEFWDINEIESLLKEYDR